MSQSITVIGHQKIGNNSFGAEFYDVSVQINEDIIQYRVGVLERSVLVDPQYPIPRNILTIIKKHFANCKL